MSSGIFSQLNFAKETTYGTGVTPARSTEFIKESLEGVYARIESAALHAAARMDATDRFVVNPTGAMGSVDLEVLDKGFGFWLEHMLGAVATTGPTDSTYTHTGTFGALLGKSFTVQVGRPQEDATVVPFTYEGCKIKSWTLTNDIDGILQLQLDIDAMKESSPTSPSGIYTLQATNYPASTKLLSYVGGSVTVGGAELDVTHVHLKCDNGLASDRRFIRSSTYQKEPVESAKRVADVELTVEFSDMTTWRRVSSATEAGALASASLAWVGAATVGAATHPSLTATIPALRFDKMPVVVDGAKHLTATVAAKVLYDRTNSPISLAYVTADTTP